MIIREFRPSDYEKISQLWKKHTEFHKELDDRALILEAMKKNPHLLLVAEEQEEIIATAFASFDGRLGIIYRVVVGQNHRQRGVASELMDELECRLRKLGCQIVGLLVLERNEAAISLYRGREYTLQPQVKYMYKDLG